MVVSTEVVARKYLDVSAGTPISVDVPCYEAADVVVYYGAGSYVAVQGTDYTVTLAGDFETFTVTPLASLIAKIDTLIAADATEINYITVRRELDYKTDATPAGVRYTPYTSREFDRNAMRDIQLAEESARSLKLPPSVVPEDGVDASLINVAPGQYVRMKADGTGFTGAEGTVAVTEVDTWYPVRDTASAAQAATLTDGTVVVLGGRIYIVDSAATGADSATADLGVDGIARFHGALDVRAFGASPLGLVDAASRIQAALDSGAKTIVLTDGTYLIGTTASDFLSFGAAQSGVKFIGAGGVLKLADNTPVLSSKSMLDVDGCDDLHISGLRVDGNARANTSNTLSSTGLVGFCAVRRSRRVIVTENIVYNSNNNGVYSTDGSREVVVSNNVFRNCFGTEMRVGLPDSGTPAEGLFIGNTVIHDADVHAGVPKQDGVMNNRWGGDAAFIGNKVLIQSGVTQTPASLIWIAQGRRTIVVGNEIVSEVAASYGIQGNITADAEEIVVKGNIFKCGDGILLTDGGGARACRSIIIEGNDIVASTQNGIQVTVTVGFTVDHLTIANNTVEYQNGYGIRTSVGNAIVTGNRVKQNGGSHGIFIGGANNVVNGNTVDMNASVSRGIEVYATDSVIASNRVYNYTGQPIKEQGSANWNLFHGNHTKGGAIATIGANTVSADNI